MAIHCSLDPNLLELLPISMIFSCLILSLLVSPILLCRNLISPARILLLYLLCYQSFQHTCRCRNISGMTLLCFCDTALLPTKLPMFRRNTSACLPCPVILLFLPVSSLELNKESIIFAMLLPFLIDIC